MTIYMLWSTGAQLSSKLLGNWSVVYMHREFLHYNNFMCKCYVNAVSIHALNYCTTKYFSSFTLLESQLLSQII